MDATTTTALETYRPGITHCEVCDEPGLLTEGVCVGCWIGWDEMARDTEPGAPEMPLSPLARVHA